MTQKDRLLQALQTRGELYVYEIMSPRPDGLGIAQYNARIKELREEGHEIINKEPGHFVYKADTAVKEEVVDDVKKTHGYQKFIEKGNTLFNKNRRTGRLRTAQELKGVDPKDMDEDELEVVKKAAEGWLENNQDHPGYPKALRRYESVCDQLSLLKGEWL